MRIFIKGMYYSIWKVAKDGLFVPMHEVNNVMVNKENEDDWTIMS